MGFTVVTSVQIYDSDGDPRTINASPFCAHPLNRRTSKTGRRIYFKVKSSEVRLQMDAPYHDTRYRELKVLIARSKNPVLSTYVHNGPGGRRLPPPVLSWLFLYPRPYLFDDFSLNFLRVEDPAS